MPALDPQILVEHQRPRPDEAHLAPHDVPQLRQLIQRAAPQQPPDPRHTRILSDLEQPLLRLVAIPQRVLQRIRVRDHRAELQHPETLAMTPDTLLREEHRPTILELHRHSNHSQERRDRQQPHHRTQQVERPLERRRRTPQIKPPDPHHRDPMQIVELNRGAHHLEQPRQHAHPHPDRLQRAHQIQHLPPIDTPRRDDRPMHIERLRQITDLRQPRPQKSCPSTTTRPYPDPDARQPPP